MRFVCLYKWIFSPVGHDTENKSKKFEFHLWNFIVTPSNTRYDNAQKERKRRELMDALLHNLNVF